MTRFVDMSKIDPDIVFKIRTVSDAESERYQILKNAIESDGQKYPIVIRRLTSDEMAVSTKRGAEYGIIDGHHRFEIAKSQGKSEILAEIDNNKADEYHDIALAFRLNESSIKMTPIEKGRVIYNLMKGEKTADQIGEEIFGLKVAMAYRCVNLYKQSIGEKVISKPRNAEGMHNKVFRKNFKDNLKNLHDIAKNKNALDSILDDEEKCSETLRNIAAFEKQLRWLKNKIKSNIVQSEEI